MTAQSSFTENRAGLSDQAAGGLAYITFLPAMYLLLSERYKQRPYVLFHAWQSIYLMIASFIITVLLGMASYMIPSLRFLTWDNFPLDSLALVILWIVVLIKAFNGERYKLPIIGSMAERKSRR